MPSPVPEGYGSITPYLNVHDADAAIDYYQRAFGATEVFRMPDDSGRIMHAEIQIGDSRVMMADEFEEWGNRGPRALGGASSAIMLYVEDVDEVFARALEAGATEIMPVQDQFYGDRSGMLEDPFGHVWTIATHKESLTAEEMERRHQEWREQQRAT